MLAPGDLQRIADVCTTIGNEVAETSGFVPIRRLLERFNISLFVQPLLVEGMLASVPAPNEADSPRGTGAVLVDSETYQVDNKEVALETEERPLPTRFRNTVAHELVHSLAFRPSEFGLRLQQAVDSDERLSELVQDVERETERLSPLLLWPERAMADILRTRRHALSPSELAHVAARMGVSRSIAVSRLRLFRGFGGTEPIDASWVRDVAVGLGEWVEQGRAVIRKWPLFANFDRNIVPNALHRVAAQDRLPASTVFADPDFAMCGGERGTITCELDAGLQNAPKVERMRVVISTEIGTRKAGTEFLFVVRKKRPEEDKHLD
jgi:hypothetical protein